MNTFGTSVILASLIAIAGSWQAKATCVADTNVSSFSVTASGPVWTYNFQVVNGCEPGHQPLLTDFFVPYFSSAGTTNITVPGPDNLANAPTTWSYSIEANNDLFGLGPGAGVIDFHVTSLANVAPNQNLPGAGYYSANGFTFDSQVASVQWPWAILETNYDHGLYETTTLLTGNLKIPFSPHTTASLAHPAIPEPGSMMLMMAGLAAFAAILKRLIRIRDFSL